MAATKVPVFISFDYDHDDDLKLLLVGQAKHDDSPFSIEDTDTATGVNAEIGIARDEKKQYFLLAGRADGGNKKPTAALGSDKMYKWTWENLKTLIAGSR